MKIFTEQAATRFEAEQLVRFKYGERAHIHNYRSVRLGGFLGFFAKEGIEVSGYLMDEPRKKQVAPDRNLEEEKRKILDAAGKPNPNDLILREIQDLKKKFSEAAFDKDSQHPVFRKIEQVLLKNDFSWAYTAEIVDRIKAAFSYDELSDETTVLEKVKRWIEEDIRIYSPADERKQLVYILVGPTGVGKTTTIAKLAAHYSLGDEKRKGRDVRIITVDNYRIGAIAQIETYGAVMKVPVSLIENQKDMVKQIQLYKDVDVILIDTIGKSPKEYVQLAEMKELLEGAGINAEAHLAVSATTKSGDIEDILSQFEIFKYKSVVVTKLDETSRIGNIISVLKEKNKPISYITDGQTVPVDLHEAKPEYLLKRLEL
jgi:flagellar biosynthesis protein FlhF